MVGSDQQMQRLETELRKAHRAVGVNCYVWKISRENEGTERDIQGVGWDMSIPLKLFLVLGGNGSLFPQTSA